MNLFVLILFFVINLIIFALALALFYYADKWWVKGMSFVACISTFSAMTLAILEVF